ERGWQRRLLGSGGGAEHRLLARQDTLGEGNCYRGPGPILDQDRGAASLRACGKAQFRFDTCLTKMRIPTCTRGYVRWRRTCYGAAPRPPINPQRPNQAMERTADRCTFHFLR